MKVGIIGAGMIVHDFLTFAGSVEGMELTAICATPEEKEKIEELSQKHGINKCYVDVDEMLKDNDVEVAYVAVPNHLHYLFCKKAMEANKHVICEKPFTSNIEELEDLVKIAKEKEVVLVEAVSTQYLPNTHEIKKTLKDLGKIKIVSANYSQYSSRYDAFKSGEVLPAFDPNKSGGALMDLNIYNINLMVALFGEPKHVNYQANIQRGIDTSGILTLDYGSFKCVCIGAKDCKAPIATNIQGDKGCINITTPANVLNGYSILMNNTKDIVEKDFNDGKHRMYHEFVEFVKMIDNRDLAYSNKMLETSLIAIDIVSKAKASANIVFGADK